MAQTYLDRGAQLFALCQIFRQDACSCIQNILSLCELSLGLEVIGKSDAIEYEVFAFVGLACHLPLHGFSTVFNALNHVARLTVHLRNVEVSLSEVALHGFLIRDAVENLVFSHNFISDVLQGILFLLVHLLGRLEVIQRFGRVLAGSQHDCDRVQQILPGCSVARLHVSWE